MKIPFYFFCEPDDGTGAGGATNTEPPKVEPPAQEPPAENSPPVDPPAPPAPPQLTPEETAAKLVRLAELEAAETVRATEAETARLAQLSEIDREKARAATAEAERDAEKGKLADEIAAGNRSRLRTQAETAARELGLTLTDSALDDAIALGEFASVTFNDQREPQGVTEAVKALVEKKPHFVTRAGAPNLSGSSAGRESGLDPSDKGVQRASRGLVRGF